MKSQKSKVPLALIAFGVGVAVILYAIVSGSPVRKVALPGGTSIEFGDKTTPSTEQESDAPVVTIPAEPAPLPAPTQDSYPVPTSQPQTYDPYDAQANEDFDEVMRQTEDFIDCLETGNSQCSVYGE